MEAGLATAERKDSQGICFVGKVDLPTFLQQQLRPKRGRIMLINSNSEHYKNNEGTLVDLQIIETLQNEDLQKIVTPYLYQPEEGTKVGNHEGAHYYTVGQRKGLSVGGMKEPIFVIGTHIDRNVVFVGMGKEHPGLFRKGLFILKEEIHNIRPDLALNIGDSLTVLARIRYRQPLQEATIHRREEGMYMVFKKPQRAITAGQFASWYLEDELIGSGVIDK